MNSLLKLEDLFTEITFGFDEMLKQTKLYYHLFMFYWIAAFSFIFTVNKKESCFEHCKYQCLSRILYYSKRKVYHQTLMYVHIPNDFPLTVHWDGTYNNDISWFEE